MSEGIEVVEGYRKRLAHAAGYSEIWELAKESVEFSLHKRRRGIMLFLDDLPIQLGAYHQVGTNNIVLNRKLITIVEATAGSKLTVNALIYNLLLHEYLHALGELSEADVRRQVYQVTRKCFGEDHLATMLAKKSPWSLLSKIPWGTVNYRKRVMSIVKDFEKPSGYIV